MKTGTQYLLATMSFAVVLAGLLTWYVFYPPVSSDVPCLDPVPWNAAVVFPEIRVDTRTGNLLLRFQSHPQERAAIYEWRKREQRFVAISQIVWDEATGQVCSDFDCGEAYPPEPPRITEGALQYRGQKVSTAGHTALRQWVCPSGKVVAVLSAAGWERPSVPGIMPFSGHWGGGYAGQHYVELFTLPDLKRKGDPVRIPLTTAEGIRSIICTAGDEYVVYTGRHGVPVCVIPTGIQEDREQ